MSFALHMHAVLLPPPGRPGSHYNFAKCTELWDVFLRLMASREAFTLTSTQY